METVSQKVAQALLDIQAIGFVPNKPITFKSGLISPVYIDNRKFPFYPQQWQVVIEGFMALSQEIDFDIVAGIESAGIPHSAALGYALGKPSVFTRKQAKDHGTKKMVEGGSVHGKTVMLIEDHVTTGGSSLLGVKALRAEGAQVKNCFAITSYEFKEASNNFATEKVQLKTLTSFAEILPLSIDKKFISQQEKEIVTDWLQDPKGWAKRHGFGD